MPSKPSDVNAIIAAARQQLEVYRRESMRLQAMGRALIAALNERQHDAS